MRSAIDRDSVKGDESPQAQTPFLLKPRQQSLLKRQANPKSKKLVDVVRSLHMENSRFVPTTDYDHQQLRTAMKEQNILLGKPLKGDGAHCTEGVPLIKKGGTRPPKEQ